MKGYWVCIYEKIDNNEKVNTPEKKAIVFKISKQWAKKINEKL